MGIKRAVQDKIALEKLKKKYRQLISPVVVSSKEEFSIAISNRKKSIYVVGEYYKIVSAAWNKEFFRYASAPVAGQLSPSIRKYFLDSKFETNLELMNYRIRMNWEQKRIELLRVRGQGKIDSKTEYVDIQ